MYDTVAINKKSAEERLFMRFSQSVTIKQAVKSQSAARLCLPAWLSSTRTTICPALQQERSRLCALSSPTSPTRAEQTLAAPASGSVARDDYHSDAPGRSSRQSFSSALCCCANGISIQWVSLPKGD